jgi:hypothetical protein
LHSIFGKDAGPQHLMPQVHPRQARWLRQPAEAPTITNFFTTPRDVLLLPTLLYTEVSCKPHVPLKSVIKPCRQRELETSQILTLFDLAASCLPMP